MASAVVVRKNAAPSGPQLADSCQELDQHEPSPFAATGVAPLDVPPCGKLQLAQPRQSPTQYSSKQHENRRVGPLARLFCCSAPVVAEPVELHTHEHPDTPMEAMHSHNSWAKVFADKLHLTASASRASSEYHDARSFCSDITPQHSLDGMLSPTPGHHPDQHTHQQVAKGVDQQLAAAVVPALLVPPQEQPHWVPKEKLLFAPPGLQWVPVPAVTGFAGLWVVDPERSSPHPQPIDIMMNVNAVVRKVHESVWGITIEETPDTFKFIANTSFVPKGFPVHIEIYDKHHKNSPWWYPRRDLALGSGRGNIYFTECGCLVIRHDACGVAAPWAKERKVEYIVEDYIRLQEDGTILDRMHVYDVKTGKHAENIQVARLDDGSIKPNKAQQ